jgi:MFS family permease
MNILKILYLKILNGYCEMLFNKIKLTLRALKHRNYRLFFMGQGLSLIGTWMQSIATSWLVYKMTNSEFMLGLAAFSGQIPAFFISPFAGVLIDRFNLRRMIIIAQFFAMIQALVLAAVTLTGTIQVWHIIFLNFILGVINAFDMPSRQSFVIQMLEDKSDLGNAIALNSSLFNASRLIGPSIAGVIIAIAGEGICFLINGISYIGVIAALLMMNITSVKTDNEQKQMMSQMKEGIKYAFNSVPIRDLLIMISLISIIALSYPVLMPVYAGNVLSGGSHTFGFLVAASGVGALSGTIFLAMRKSVRGLTHVITAALLLSGSALLLLSFSKSIMFSMILLVFIGFGMIAAIASINTILQTIVEQDKRGRVMSLYTMAFMGTAPLGSILVGIVSSGIGVPMTMTVSGILTIIGSILLILRMPLLRKSIRPIYQKMGIIPEVALGIQTTTELSEPPESSGN